MRTIYFLIFVFLLAGCAPDPRDAADAERTLLLTEQDVLDREQARTLELERARVWNERWGRAMDALAAGARVGLGIAGFAAALGAGIGLGTLLAGLGAAGAKAALFRADWVPLDPRTRQYPMIRQWVAEDGRRLVSFGRGVYLMGNPNDGSVTAFDESRPGDRQKIAGMTGAWELGVVASEAGKSSDPAGVAVIAPAVTNLTGASAELIEVLEARDGKQ